MIPKKPAPHSMRGGYRFSEKDHAQTKSWSGMMNRKKIIPNAGAIAVTAA
jgi:hypothetical protein